MASRCNLCDRNMKSGQPTGKWKNPTDQTSYTVHAACLAHLRGNGHLYDQRTLKRKP